MGAIISRLCYRGFESHSSVRRSMKVRESKSSVSSGSSKKTTSPASKSTDSEGVTRVSAYPKLTARLSGTTTSEMLSADLARTSSSDTAVRRKSKHAASIEKRTSQYSGVDSSSHLRNSSRASGRPVLTINRLPKFMKDAIKRISLGIEDPRERAWFEERLKRTRIIPARSRCDR